MSKIDVPQADEQQRLLANLITEMNRDKAPLPRFWYLPRGEKAARRGDRRRPRARTARPAFFDRLKASSPAGCSVADWECVRATSYMYPDTADDRRPGRRLRGRRLRGRRCTWSPAPAARTSRRRRSTSDLTTPARRASPPPGRASRSRPPTAPTASSGATGPPRRSSRRRHGIRFDTNYYYNGPPGWLTKPGLLTGSGFPQRFADLDGSMIDVYQAMTQVTDESEMPMAPQVDTLLDNALGSEGVVRRGHRLNPHRPRRPRQRERHRGLRAGPRRAGGVLGARCSTGSTGATAPPSRTWPTAAGSSPSRSSRTRRRAASRRCCPPSRPPDRCRGLTRGGQPVTREHAHRQGRGLLRLQGRRAATTRPPTRTTTAAPAITNVNAAADADGHATVTWADRRARELARGLRAHHRARQPGLRQRPRDRAQHRAHRPEPQHDLPLPRDLGGRRGQLGQLAGRRAGAGHASRRRPAPSWTTAPPSSAPARTAPPTRARPSPAATARSQLQPTVGEEFEGTALPRGWSVLLLGPRRQRETSGGALVVDGAVHLHARRLRRSARDRVQRHVQAGERRGGGLRQRSQRLPVRGVRHRQRRHALPDVRPERRRTRAPSRPRRCPGVSLNSPHRFRIEWNADERRVLRGRRRSWPPTR